MTSFLVLILSGVIALANDGDLLLRAEYRLPLSEADVPELSEYNSFSLVDYRIDRRIAGSERMAFDLPLVLTGGESLPVILQVVSQEGSLRRLAGPLGEAICQGPWVSMECQFVFVGLNLDPAKVDAFVDSMPVGSGERESLRRLARQFSGDPIGVARVLGPR